MKTAHRVDPPLTRPDALQSSPSFRRTATLFGLLSALFLLWVTLGIGGDWMANAVDDLGELVAALVAAAVCAVASRRNRYARKGWLLMSLSSLSWACGEAVWSYYDLIRGIELPSPSGADLGFLVAVPLAVFGLRSLFPNPARRAMSRLGGLFGGMLLGSGALVVFWSLTLLHDSAGNELVQQLVGVAYPLGDLVMAAVVLSAVSRGTGDRTTMRLVLAGIVAFTVADTWFAVVVTVGDFGMGYWLDTGWVLGYFLVALGALWASQHPARATHAPGVTSTRFAVGQRQSGQHWLATANTDHIVNYAAIVLIVVDTAVVLYDLAAILKLMV